MMKGQLSIIIKDIKGEKMKNEMNNLKNDRKYTVLAGIGITIAGVAAAAFMAYTLMTPVRYERLRPQEDTCPTQMMHVRDSFERSIESFCNEPESHYVSRNMPVPPKPEVCNPISNQSIEGYNPWTDPNSTRTPEGERVITIDCTRFE